MAVVDSETLAAPLLEPIKTPLDLSLHRLESFLSLLGFSFASSPLLHSVLSCSAFLLFGVATPAAVVYLSRFSSCTEYQFDRFELCAFISEASLAAVSLVCVSKNLYKYGIRKFLFVDHQHGQVQRFQDQYVRKIQTTGYSELVNFANAGNLAVSSVVQVVGVVLCLHSAAKISHRAQGVASVASKWHALMTCSSTDSSQFRAVNGTENWEVAPASSIPMDFSESDLESLDNINMHASGQVASYLTSYHKRQALVLYLQSNPGGITIFGWTVDRTLINTIFFIELSLVLFVLGKTIVYGK